MKDLYTKPEVSQRASLTIEKCFASALSSGDEFGPCPTCPKGIVNKSETIPECIECMNTPLGDINEYIFCQREGL